MFAKNVSQLHRPFNIFITNSLSPRVVPNFQQPQRNLFVPEHVCYTFMKQAGITLPKFGVAKTKEEAGEIARQLNTEDMVLKAQVLTGGRGKGRFKGGLKSGVHFVHSPEETESVAAKMLGDYLITKQTGEKGKICNTVMLIERKFPRREFYAAYFLDRAYDGPVFMASSQGGINIEEVAADSPDSIIYEPIDILEGIRKETVKSVLDKIDLHTNQDEAINLLLKLYELFVQKDIVLLEVNPLAEDTSGHYYCLDCKIQFDDNAKFRQEVHKYTDWSQVDEKEVEAAKANLNYIALEGNIGCMVNGAGLAMATMDIIKLHGGSPANFLDVGGGATAHDVGVAFKIITSDPQVSVILVNIFGGIMRCDVIAKGIISAVADLKLDIPIVCRLQGTKVDEAKLLIASSSMKILGTDCLDEAARLAVKLSNIMDLARGTKLKVNFELPL